MSNAKNRARRKRRANGRQLAPKARRLQRKIRLTRARWQRRIDDAVHATVREHGFSRVIGIDPDGRDTRMDGLTDEQFRAALAKSEGRE